MHWTDGSTVGEARTTSRDPSSRGIYFQSRLFVRRELLAESQKYRARKLLCQDPLAGPIRVAVLLGIAQTPRFRTKRQLWSFSGLCIEMHSSADYREVEGQLRRAPKPAMIRELTENHNQDLGDILGHLDRGGTVVFRQEDVGDGHWQPVFIEANMRGRLLFLSLSLNQRIVDSDYDNFPTT